MQRTSGLETPRSVTSRSGVDIQARFEALSTELQNTLIRLQNAEAEIVESRMGHAEALSALDDTHALLSLFEEQTKCLSADLSVPCFEILSDEVWIFELYLFLLP